MTEIPYPIPDPDRPWGNAECLQVWIACDLCDHWYHLSCEGLRSPPLDVSVSDAKMFEFEFIIILNY